MEASLDVTDLVRLLATEVEETGWSIDLIPISASDHVCLRITRPSPQSGPGELQVLEVTSPGHRLGDPERTQPHHQIAVGGRWSPAALVLPATMSTFVFATHLDAAITNAVIRYAVSVEVTWLSGPRQLARDVCSWTDSTAALRIVVTRVGEMEAGGPLETLPAIALLLIAAAAGAVGDRRGREA